MRKFVICLVMLLLVSSPASACIGARQAAMGWAGVAISDDATASYWNPAAMVWAKDGVMYDNFLDRTAVAAKVGNVGLHYVKEWDKAYCAIGYGHQLSNNTSIGVNVGLANYGNSRDELFTDVSYIHHVGELTFGVLAQNFSNIRPEIAYTSNFLTVTAGFYDLFDVCKNYNDDGASVRDFHSGVELRPVSFLALRSGYNSDYENLIYGAGIKLSFLSIDFVHMEEDYCSVTFKF